MFLACRNEPLEMDRLDRQQPICRRLSYYDGTIEEKPEEVVLEESSKGGIFDSFQSLVIPT